MSESCGTTFATRLHRSACDASIGGEEHLHRDPDTAGVDEPDDPTVAVVIAAARLE
jgi:hypothetical protein